LWHVNRKSQPSPFGMYIFSRLGGRIDLTVHHIASAMKTPLHASILDCRRRAIGIALGNFCELYISHVASLWQFIALEASISAVLCSAGKALVRLTTSSFRMSFFTLCALQFRGAFLCLQQRPGCDAFRQTQNHVMCSTGVDHYDHRQNFLASSPHRKRIAD
jgi:hypothetical protein